MQFDPGMEYRPGWGDGRYFIVYFLTTPLQQWGIFTKTIIQYHWNDNENRCQPSDFSVN